MGTKNWCVFENKIRSKYDQKAVLEIMRLAKTHCIQVLNIWWWVGQKILNGAGKYSSTPVSRYGTQTEAFQRCGQQHDT